LHVFHSRVFRDDTDDFFTNVTYNVLFVTRAASTTYCRRS
jgi:hypothetical protein